jgi:hypothetical protein
MRKMKDYSLEMAPVTVFYSYRQFLPLLRLRDVYHMIYLQCFSQ